MLRLIPLRLLSFLFIGSSIIITCLFILRSEFFNANPDLLSFGLTLDLTIAIPVVYILIIRKTNIPLLTTVPIFIVSYIIALFIIPENNQYYLGFIEYLFIPLEIFIASFVIYKTYKIRKAIRNYGSDIDFTETLRKVINDQFGNATLANIFTTEISLFYYLFTGWGKTKTEFTANQYSYHKKNGYTSLFVAFFFVMILETLALHLFVNQFFPILAWILTGLGIYFGLVLLGDYNAIKQRPIRIDDNTLVLRIGIRWYSEIPISNIHKIEFIRSEPKEDNNANFVSFGSPNVIVHLISEHHAIGFYGISKKFTSFSTFIDDKINFKQEIDDKTQMDKYP